MSIAFTADDRAWMNEALRLAARGRGRVEPNPMVGCVIVQRGAVIGRGFHRRFGGPHAEIDALRGCGRPVRDGTAYVTLEPCCHQGKTPPCTDALLEAGIRRVVVAMGDPFTDVAGRGIRQLRRAGVRVDVGLCRSEAERLNAPYLMLQRRGRPWVIVKWAQSLDGRIATRTGNSRWISSSESRTLVQRLRGRVDAILVGSGTALADDPALTCRLRHPLRIATRIVVDGRLRVPMRLGLVRTARDVPVVIATTTVTARRKARHVARLQNAGVDVLALPARRGHVDLAKLLASLGRRGMTNVLAEGGGTLNGALFDAGLVDEAFVFVAARIIGGDHAVSAVGGRGAARVQEALTLTDVSWRRLGADWVGHGYASRPRQPLGD